MKPLSIPKLELQSALLATRLKEKILAALTIHIDREYMWTDSTTVLQWLASTEKQPVFVANRVAEILEDTTIDKWFHVGTGDNPADADTRGLSAASVTESIWVRGPDFLRSDGWPFKPSPESQKIQLKAPAFDPDNINALSLNAVSSVKLPVIDWAKYSSYSKLKWVVAYALRLLPKHRNFCTANSLIEDPSEL